MELMEVGKAIIRWRRHHSIYNWICCAVTQSEELRRSKVRNSNSRRRTPHWV